jgi:hypothetical protein
MRLEGLGKLKNTITISSEIEPATFCLVVYCLNQLRCRVPVTEDLQYVTTNN